ncbi:MAG: hypothetical protein U5O39_20160 [Gammaproteobacteria bacterium]|nr:hypothetical protein [Gammaproteobacteria bacterium]
MNMGLAMVLASAGCIILGIYPELIYPLLPDENGIPSGQGRQSGVLLAAIAVLGLAFFVLLPLMKRTETISLDTDWLWRRFGLGIAKGIGIALSAIGSS